MSHAHLGATGRPVSIDAIRHIEAADRHWQSGDKALANLRLVFADLPRLTAAEDSWCLSLAEHLLDNGMTPNDLAAELGLPAMPMGLDKYTPDQPRVPAGHGRESGRFTSGGAGQVSSPPGASMPETALLAPVGSAPSIAGPETIGSLLPRLAGPLAFIAAMVIPTRNSGGVDEGTLPDMPDVHFRRDGPAGTLALTTKDADGTDVAVLAHNQAGAYVDARTETEIGRDLGSSISLDRAAIRAAVDAGIDPQAREEPDRRPKTTTDEPEVCPAPEKDRGHGAKQRALDYEDDVHARVNPTNPIPRGYAVRVWDPSTGRYIYFDDCYRNHGDWIDGDMKPGDLAEAKGPGYDRAFSRPYGNKAMEDLAYDAGRQLSAADFRGVGLKMYFAEKGAADLVRKKFGSDPQLSRIVISHMPPRKGSR